MKLISLTEKIKKSIPHWEQIKIRLYHTDAVGVIYFARLFEIANTQMERLFEDIGYPFYKIINNNSFITPVVHSESDYILSISFGETVDIGTYVENIGHKSVTICSEFYKLTDTSNILYQCAQAKTVHVFIDKKTKQSISIPPNVREVLSQCLRK